MSGEPLGGEFTQTFSFADTPVVASSMPKDLQWGVRISFGDLLGVGVELI